MKKLALMFLLMILLISCIGQKEEDINKRVTEIESQKNKDNEDKYLELWTTGLYWADKDKKTAEKYYLAAAKYNKEAYSMIGNMYYFRGEKEKGKEKYREGFVKRDMNSAFELGGVYDAEGNLKEAMEWYMKAAEGGHREAQFNLAVVYDNDKNDIEAEKWYLKAAKNGHQSAMFNLGYLYVRRMEKLRNESFKKGIKYEEELLLAKKFHQSKINAEEWYLKAIENGSIDAKYNLAVLYEESSRIEEAKKWYIESAKSGNKDAEKILEEKKFKD